MNGVGLWQSCPFHPGERIRLCDVAVVTIQDRKTAWAARYGDVCVRLCCPPSADLILIIACVKHAVGHKAAQGSFGVGHAREHIPPAPDAIECNVLE